MIQLVREAVVPRSTKSELYDRSFAVANLSPTILHMNDTPTEAEAKIAELEALWRKA